MNCERFEALLPDYLQGALGHSEKDQMEQHMEQCARCKETVAVWNQLAELPQEQPSPMLRERFEAMLKAYQEGQAEKSDAGLPRRALLPFLVTGNWWRAAAATAFAVVLLAAGFAAGRYAGATRSTDTSREEITRMHEEVRDMRQLVVLSMLQQQSASERLQGITLGAQQAQMDTKVLTALLQTLRFDSSVDVRLSALHALSRHSSQPVVRTGLHDALLANQSPLVQVALIDLLVEMRDTGALAPLQKVRQDSTLNPAVRQRAAQALRELH